ncbi:hypothetical protein TNCV_5130411 [Trichonephila clavipes]|nr:hypothetical protein TNCV_5130411 [Trichonephila clavipes]
MWLSSIRASYFWLRHRIKVLVKVVTPKCLGGLTIDRDRLDALPVFTRWIFRGTWLELMTSQPRVRSLELGEMVPAQVSSSSLEHG